VVDDDVLVGIDKERISAVTEIHQQNHVLKALAAGGVDEDADLFDIGGTRNGALFFERLGHGGAFEDFKAGILGVNGIQKEYRQ
jgi:hypothetical protein